MNKKNKKLHELARAILGIKKGETSSGPQEIHIRSAIFYPDAGEPIILLVPYDYEKLLGQRGHIEALSIRIEFHSATTMELRLDKEAKRRILKKVMKRIRSDSRG